MLRGVCMRVSKREIPEQLRSQERLRKDVNGGQGRSEGPSYCRAVPRAPLPLRTDGGLSFPTQLSPSRSDTTPMPPGAPRPMHIALTRQPLCAPPAWHAAMQGLASTFLTLRALCRVSHVQPVRPQRSGVSRHKLDDAPRAIGQPCRVMLVQLVHLHARQPGDHFGFARA